MKTGTLLTLGVGLAAVVGLFFLRGKDKAPEPGKPAVGPAPPQGGSPPAPGYAVTSKNTGPALSSLVLLGDPLALRQNVYYRGRMHPGAFAPFDAASDHDSVAKGLSALGFADVRVFLDVQSLPSDWPSSTVSDAPPGSRYFFARWSGLTSKLPRPAEIDLLWMSKAPS